MVSIIGIIIGVLIFIAGVYYFRKEKNDAESRKIYSIVAIIGLIVALVSLLVTIL